MQAAAEGDDFGQARSLQKSLSLLEHRAVLRRVIALPPSQGFTDLADELAHDIASSIGCGVDRVRVAWPLHILLRVRPDPDNPEAPSSVALAEAFDQALAGGDAAAGAAWLREAAGAEGGAGWECE